MQYHKNYTKEIVRQYKYDRALNLIKDWSYNIGMLVLLMAGILVFLSFLAWA